MPKKNLLSTIASMSTNVEKIKVELDEFCKRLTNRIEANFRKFSMMFEPLIDQMDWRTKRRRDYNLTSMVLVSAMAVCAGSTTVVGMRNYWKQNRYSLAELDPELAYVPSRSSTMERVWLNIDIESLTRTFCGLNMSMYLRNRLTDGNYSTSKLSERDVVSADGQNINATQILLREQPENESFKRSSGYDVTSLYSYHTAMG